MRGSPFVSSILGAIVGVALVASSQGQSAPPTAGVHFSVFSIPSLQDPGSLASGDLTNNQIQDLIAASGEYQTLFVGLGNGHGGLPTWNSGLVSTFPVFITLGDVNLDGNLDAVTLDAQSNDLGISFGNGQGGFSSTYTFTGFGNYYPSSVAVADLNLDGKPDLVGTSAQHAANEIGAVFVLLGNGDGTFQHLRQFPTHGESPGSIVVADFNGDHIPDVAVANGVYNSGAGSVGILLGNGDGTFQPVRRYKAGGYPFQIVVGDFNGDGIPDIAVLSAGTYNKIHILLGNGDGTFRLSPGDLSVGYDVTSIVAADFNGDGKLDLAVCDVITGKPGYVSVFLGNGDGTFQGPTSFQVGEGPDRIVTADFNGDGKPDLATVDSVSSTVTILINATKWPEP